MNGYDEQTQRILSNLEGVDFTTLSLWEFEDLFEDRDPFEFI